MKNFLAPFIFVATLFCASEWAAADMLSLQASGGAACNFRLPLVIRQDGQDTIRHNADYDTKPFETPIYTILSGSGGGGKTPPGSWSWSIRSSR